MGFMARQQVKILRVDVSIEWPRQIPLSWSIARLCWKHTDSIAAQATVSFLCAIGVSQLYCRESHWKRHWDSACLSRLGWSWSTHDCPCSNARKQTHDARGRELTSGCTYNKRVCPAWSEREQANASTACNFHYWKISSQRTLACDYHSQKVPFGGNRIAQNNSCQQALCNRCPVQFGNY